MKHTPGPWRTGENPPQPLYRGIIAILEHSGDKFVATWVDDGPPAFHAGANAEANAHLIALAPTAPHECDPECPGEINRRKLVAFDALLEALTELIVVGDLRGDTSLPHPADDPITWTARMQFAWDDARAMIDNYGGQDIVGSFIDHVLRGGS